MKRTKAKINAMKRPADLVAAQEKMRSKHEGRTTTTAPQPFLPPTDSAVEQHFTPAQVAQQWGMRLGPHCSTPSTAVLQWSRSGRRSTRRR